MTKEQVSKPSGGEIVRWPRNDLVGIVIGRRWLKRMAKCWIVIQWIGGGWAIYRKDFRDQWEEMTLDDPVKASMIMPKAKLNGAPKQELSPA